MTCLYLIIPCFPNYVSPSLVKFFPSTKLHLACTKTSLTQTFTKPSSLHCLPSSSMSSLTGLAPLEAVLFDVDGTLCDSDPLHYEALREMLLKIGFNGGVPITEEFFVEKFSGKNNIDAASVPFPDDPEQGLKFVEDKEAMFQRLAREQLKPVKGLEKVTAWVEKRGLKRAAVTNSPRVNAELMISKLGLSDFFDVLIIGDECERGKPHPDPYLKALEVLKASKDHTFVFEDSFSGITAGVAAGMPVIGIAIRNPEDLLMKAKPDFLIKDYEDPKLWAALEELDKPGAEKLEILDKNIQQGA
ncbi:haloacid dehalogenase-like hydrolase domain-containing protein Sgpp isoform X1 [Vigna unguiculata]|uniref:haloacid dehalogenase-like hydrolase domain-containing protein Sgpp isoform X1 n=1 Tax=Vigna unguiculata TaxID=3917 RepID=UPI001016FA05|nr:haloacid dehalogenase-like hydrolase domain-containing protein Sgpp isoform X1 [Vigna unguiculata]